MTTFLRLAPLALTLLPFLSLAQTGPVGLVGLEIPAPAPSSRGHFLAGAYVVGNYTPLPTATGYGYGVRPYLRYRLGGGTSRPRPFLQYTFSAYQMANYATGPLYGPEGAGLPANPGFAPLAARGGPYGYGAYGSYGGLGAFSVGIPMQIGRSSAVLNVGGAVLEGLLKSAIW